MQQFMLLFFLIPAGLSFGQDPKTKTVIIPQVSKDTLAMKMPGTKNYSANQVAEATLNRFQDFGLDTTRSTKFTVHDRIKRINELRLYNGQIKTDKGETIPFATITIKGTNAATSADANGNFSIKIGKDDKLVVSHVGYSTVEFDPNKTDITIGGVNIKGKQSITNSEVTETIATDLNVFPLPYPIPSTTYVLPNSLLSKMQFLYQVDSALQVGLNKCSYDNRHYYYIPHGFALITQMEQIDDSGVSLEIPPRWDTKISSNINNPWDYFVALVSAPVGDFRVFVFLITDIDHSAGKNLMSEAEARKWLDNGTSILPKDLRSVKINNDYNCTLLVYHYKKTAGQQGKIVTNDGITGKTHYIKSNLPNYIK